MLAVSGITKGLPVTHGVGFAWVLLAAAVLVVPIAVWLMINPRTPSLLFVLVFVSATWGLCHPQLEDFRDPNISSQLLLAFSSLILLVFILLALSHRWTLWENGREIIHVLHDEE